MKSKIKNYFKKDGWYKPLLKTLLILTILATIALIAYFTLRALGFTSVEEFTKLRNQLGDSLLFWLVIGLLQIVQVIFIPISNQVITVPVALVFPNELWKVFITSWISIWIATLILYLIGRLGGKKIISWILNDPEKTNKCADWLKHGWMFYPLGMLLPLPDDIITVLAGTSRMNFFFVLGCSFITRGIDVACSVYGWGFLSHYWWGWLIIALFFTLLGLTSFLVWKKYHKKGDY